MLESSASVLVFFGARMAVEPSIYTNGLCGATDAWSIKTVVIIVSSPGLDALGVTGRLKDMPTVLGELLTVAILTWHQKNTRLPMRM